VAEATTSWDAVCAWRLARQRLEPRATAAELVDVASALCGLHAQLTSSAELTLWARIEHLSPGALRAALWEERTLVKTWAMRGTLHLLPSDELALWLAGLRRRAERHYLNGPRLRSFGITRELAEQAVIAVGAALGGDPLTREELAQRIEQQTGSAAIGELARESWGGLLKPAAARSLLCFAPGAGQTVRFTRPDTWLGPQPAVDETAAEDAVTRRFLGAYGPAGADDLSRWLGAPGAWGKRLLARLGDELCEVDVEGRTGWLLRADLPSLLAAQPSSAVRLLPAFDQYVVGVTKHTDRLMPADLLARVYRQQGWLSPVVTVGGRLVGTWRSEVKRRQLLLSVDAFTPLSRPVRHAVEAEAQRLTAFLGLDLSLSV
jgi:hypothetical protein